MLYFKTLINMKLRQPPLVCFYGHKNCVVSVKGIKEKKSDLKSEFSQKFVAFLNFEMQVWKSVVWVKCLAGKFECDILLDLPLYTQQELNVWLRTNGISLYKLCK